MNKIDFPLDVLQANFYNLIDAHVQFEPSKNKNTDGVFILGLDGEKAIKINYKLIIKYTNPTKGFRYFLSAFFRTKIPAFTRHRIHYTSFLIQSAYSTKTLSGIESEGFKGL